VPGSWLAVLWGAFGASLLIGVLSLNVVWNRVSPLVVRLGGPSVLVAGAMTVAGVVWVAVAPAARPVAVVLILVGAAIVLYGLRRARSATATEAEDQGAQDAQRDPAPEPTPPSAAPAPGAADTDDLKQRLLEQLEAGRELKAGVVGPLFRAMANPLEQSTTPQMVKHWEETVAYVLDSAERSDLTTSFLEPAPQEPLKNRMLYSTAHLLLSGKPLEDRIEFRLVRLNTIIQRRL